MNCFAAPRLNINNNYHLQINLYAVKASEDIKRTVTCQNIPRQPLTF